MSANAVLSANAIPAANATVKNKTVENRQEQVVFYGFI
jgi:hypothetical protein